LTDRDERTRIYRMQEGEIEVDPIEPITKLERDLLADARDDSAWEEPIRVHPRTDTKKVSSRR
jgi:hypothetical protein